MMSRMNMVWAYCGNLCELKEEQKKVTHLYCDIVVQDVVVSELQQQSQQENIE